MNTAVTKKRFVFLYLAIACFLGILLIFVFDGYVGTRLSLTMDNGRYPQTIESVMWENERYPGYYSLSAERTDMMNFTLSLENRRFSSFSEPVHVFLRDNAGNETGLLQETLSAGAFGSSELSWNIRTSDLFPGDYPESTQLVTNIIMQIGSYEGTVKLFVYNPATVIPRPVVIEE